MNNLKELKREPDAEVIAGLETLLESARAGKLRGYCMLTNDPQSSAVGYSQSGEWSAADAIYAFECWKHRFLHRWQEGLGDS